MASASSSTAPVTTSTAMAVVSAAAVSQSAGAASAQNSSASATNQIAVTILSREERIAELATKDAKKLNLMLRKAKEKGNAEKISEIEAARAIRHAKHEERTGQKVVSQASAAAAAPAQQPATAPAAAATPAKSDDVKDHKSDVKTDTKTSTANSIVPYVQPTGETMAKFQTDVNFAKLVIGLAVNEKVTDAQLQQFEVRDASVAETYRMVRSLRHPFLQEELSQTELLIGMMPHIYQGATCHADVFRNLIANDVARNKSVALLRTRLRCEQSIRTDASSSALTLLAIEKIQAKG